MQTSQTVSAIVLNYNGIADTVACVRSLFSSSCPVHVVVVDNGSKNEEARRIRETFGEDIELIANPTNDGFAGGNNIALRLLLDRSDVRYIALINNDLMVEPSTIEEMVRVAESDQQVGMVAARMMNFFRRDEVDNLGIFLTASGLGYNRKTEQYPLFCPSGGCALYRSSALRDIAPDGQEVFDGDFFAYVEDLDVGFRIRLAGYTAAFAAKAVAFHKGGATAGSGLSDFSLFHGHRNNVWFVVKNFPGRLLLTNGWRILLVQCGTFFLFARRKKLKIAISAKWAACKKMARMLQKRKGIQSTRVASVDALRPHMVNKIFPGQEEG